MAARPGLCLLVAFAAMSAGRSDGWPQVEPLGPEFQVNVFTTGEASSPKVSAAPDGSFTVAWECDSCPGSGVVVGRRFDPSGQALGGEVPLSESVAGWPADVGTDPQGDFVLVWGQGSAGPGGGDPDYVKGRRVTVEGMPVGAQFVVSEPPGTEYTGQSTIAVHADGEFVVAWQEYVLLARRFDAGGVPLEPAFEVAPLAAYLPHPAIAAEPDGGFLVIWNDYYRFVWDWQIRGRRYDAQGAPVGPSFPITEPETETWSSDLVVYPDATFVTAWAESSAGIGEVRARRFDPFGTPMGAELLLGSHPGEPWIDDVTISDAPSGEHVVAWSSWGSPGSDSSRWSVQARRFSPEWTPLGNQFQVNTLTTDDQYRPTVAMQPSGDFVVVWKSSVSGGTDISDTSIQARRFRVPFFLDGFETGDTSRWSASAPIH